MITVDSKLFEDPNVTGLVRLLELSAYKIWNAVLSGSMTPHQKEIYDDMQNPQVGDLVIEQSTLHWGKMKSSDGKTIEGRGIGGIGYLEKILREPVWTEEQAKESGWNLEVDGPIPTEKIYYLRLFDGRVFRWSNASFLKVPIKLE